MTGDAESKTLTFCVEHHLVLLLSIGMCYCYCFSESNLKLRHIDMKRTAQLSWLFRSDLTGFIEFIERQLLFTWKVADNPPVAFGWCLLGEKQ